MNRKKWDGLMVHVYFPDEGSVALARHDWMAVLPPCVQFSSCDCRAVQQLQRQQSGDDGAAAASDVIALFSVPGPANLPASKVWYDATADSAEGRKSAASFQRWSPRSIW